MLISVSILIHLNAFILLFVQFQIVGFFHKLMPCYHYSIVLLLNLRTAMHAAIEHSRHKCGGIFKQQALEFHSFTVSPAHLSLSFFTLIASQV